MCRYLYAGVGVGRCGKGVYLSPLLGGDREHPRTQTVLGRVQVFRGGYVHQQHVAEQHQEQDVVDLKRAFTSWNSST
jgi:hypothetical protein